MEEKTSRGSYGTERHVEFTLERETQDLMGIHTYMNGMDHIGGREVDESEFFENTEYEHCMKYEQ